MTEDRFGDLGPSRPSEPAPEESEDERSAAERFADLDERQPEPDERPKPPKPPDLSNRYAWVVGVVISTVVIVGLITQVLPNENVSLQGPRPGERLEVFAAPSATGTSDADPNVKQSPTDEDTTNRTPACDVRGPEIVNLCDLRERPLVLTFIVTRGTGCEPQLDRVQRVSREFPDLTWLAVVGGNKRQDVARLVRERGVTYPVAVDRRGALLNLYGVGVCPTTTFARPGGIVRETRLGNLSEEQLRTLAERLRRDSGSRKSRSR
jgi:peroxiredoxin